MPSTLTVPCAGVDGLPFGAIVSSLPLLNHPMARRLAYMEAVTRRLAPGAPLIQFSYGAHAPVVPPPGFAVVRTAQVWANIPPARGLGLPEGLRLLLQLMLQQKVQHSDLCCTLCCAVSL